MEAPSDEPVGLGLAAAPLPHHMHHLAANGLGGAPGAASSAGGDHWAARPGTMAMEFVDFGAAGLGGRGSPPGGPPSVDTQLAQHLEEQLATAVRNPVNRMRVFGLLNQLQRHGQDPQEVVLRKQLLQLAAETGRVDLLPGLLDYTASGPQRLALATEAANAAFSSSAEGHWAAARFLLFHALDLAAELMESAAVKYGTMSNLIEQLEKVVEAELEEAGQPEAEPAQRQLEAALSVRDAALRQLEAAQRQREAAQCERDAAQRELRGARKSRMRWGMAGAALGAVTAVGLVALGWALLGSRKAPQATAIAGRRSR